MFARKTLDKHGFGVCRDSELPFRNKRQIKIIAAAHVFFIVFADNFRIAFKADINRRRKFRNEITAVFYRMADFMKARRIAISDKDFLFIIFGIDDDFRRYFCKLFCGGAVNIVVYRVKRDVLLKPDKFFVVTYVIIAAPPLGLNCKIRGLLHFDACNPRRLRESAPRG